VPFRPPRPCAYPGCPLLTRERFCPDHAKLVARQYENYSRDPDTWKRYGGAWRRVRASYLSAHPLCERCETDGRLIPATEVHHKFPLDRGGTHNSQNLMSLCKPCHSAITMRETMGR
jgi:5-methylcytosine-specific restriction protein A